MANSNITHPFVSGQPDGSDPTQVQPSNWNAQHLITTPDGLGTGASGVLTGTDVSGVLGINATQTSGALKYFRRNNKDNGFEFVKDKVNYCPDFNFAAQTPGGSLVIGSNTITLNPVPPGINSTSINIAKVWISAGTGTAEACLITGFSGSTITFTCANTHSGAWTITSASDGLQEALVGLNGANGTVVCDPTAMMSVRCKVTFPPGRIALDGINFFNYAMKRTEDYPNGDLLFIPATAIVSLKNMWISNGTVAAQTSGAGIAYGTGADADLHKINVVGGYYGYDFNGTSTIDWVMCGFNSAGSSSRAGVWIHDTVGGHTPVNSAFNGGTFILDATVWGILIQAIDGLQIQNVNFGHGAIQMYISLGGVAGNYISSILAQNLFMDNANQSAVKIDGPAGTMTNIKFNHCSFQGDGNINNTYGLDMGFTNGVTSGLYNWSVLNSYIQGWQRAGVAVGVTCTQGLIAGCTIGDNNQGNTSDGGIRLDTAISFLSICGNRISNFLPGGSIGHQKWAIAFLNGASKMTITGNSLNDNELSPISMSGAFTTTQISNNEGLDDVIPTAVPSATSIAAPVNPSFGVTGVTTITTITGGWTGRTIKIFKTDASSVTVGGGGNIPLAHTLASGGGLTLTFDGTNWY